MKKKILFLTVILIFCFSFYGNTQNKKANEPTLSVSLKNDSVNLNKQSQGVKNTTSKISVSEKTENSALQNIDKPKLGTMEKKED